MPTDAMATYTFRKALPGEEETVYSIIAARIRWMDEKGIEQWNKTGYLERYPLSYYREHLDRMYVLTEADTGAIVCAGVLYEQDPRWDAKANSEPSFFLHHLVSDPAHPGTAPLYLKEAEALAIREGKQYLRLDSANQNKQLEAFYTSLGFTACGKCLDGRYDGILREKKLRD